MTCIARMNTYCGDGLFWRAEGISEMMGRVQSSYHATDNELKDEMTETKAVLAKTVMPCMTTPLRVMSTFTTATEKIKSAF